MQSFKRQALAAAAAAAVIFSNSGLFPASAHMPSAAVSGTETAAEQITETAADPQSEQETEGILYLALDSYGGSVTVMAADDKTSRQVFSVDESGEGVSVTDSSGNTSAAELIDGRYCLKLEAQAGRSFLIKAEAADGFRISSYRQTIDTGSEEEIKTAFPDGSEETAFSSEVQISDDPQKIYVGFKKYAVPAQEKAGTVRFALQAAAADETVTVKRGKRSAVSYAGSDNHHLSRFSFSHGGIDYLGVCNHVNMPNRMFDEDISSAKMSIAQSTAVSLRDKASLEYRYAKVIYNIYYNDASCRKIFKKFPPVSGFSAADITNTYRLYYIQVTLSYLTGRYGSGSSSLKKLLYTGDNADYKEYDVNDLGKNIWKWVSSSADSRDLPENVSIYLSWVYPDGSKGLSTDNMQPVVGFYMNPHTFRISKKAVSSDGKAVNIIPAGAQYRIYADRACTDAVATLTISADGRSGVLPAAYFRAGAVYYIKEIKAPAASPPSGFEWVTDTMTHSFSWDLAADKVLDLTDTLKHLPVPVSLKKISDSSSSDLVKGNPLYSLAGAVYGVWRSASCSGEPDQKGATDAAGNISFAGMYDAGATVYIKEISPSAGYKADIRIYTLKLDEDPGRNRIVSTEMPVSAPLKLTKISSVREDTASSFDGALFKAEYFPNSSWSGTAVRSWYFVSRGGKIEYDPSYLAAGYKSDALYQDAQGSCQLPLGTVYISELKAPEGYTAYTGKLKYSVRYDAASQKAAVGWESDPHLKEGTEAALMNAPIFGGVRFLKTDAETGKNIPQEDATLAGAVIAIYNKSGKAVLAKENGTYRAVADGGLAATVRTDTEGRASTASDALGYGKYYAVEQSAPLGYSINSKWRAEFSVDSSGTVTDATANTLEQSYIRIRTSAESGGIDESPVYEEAEDGSRSFRDIHISDTVNYENLPEGAFLVQAVLMDKRTEKPLANAKGRTFTACALINSDHDASGTVRVELEITKEDVSSFTDDSGSCYLEGASLSVFEKLYALPEKTDPSSVLRDPGKYTASLTEKAKHENLNDISQDIRFPRGRTHAAESSAAAGNADGQAAVGSQEMPASEKMSITDRVSYENLHGNTVYTVSGVLHYADGSVVMDDSGNIIKSTKEFKTTGEYDDSVSGSVDVIFGPFSGLQLAGKTVVAFESIERDGIKVMIHADTADAAQTVHIPAIRTTASAAGMPVGFHEITAGRGQTITDTVSYENLVPGREYLLEGSLVYQCDLPEEGIRAGDPLVINGEKISTQKHFTAAGKVPGSGAYAGVSGTAELSFDFDASGLGGRSVAVFEKLFALSGKESSPPKEIAAHEDISDKDQTVSIPALSTKAEDKINGTHESQASAKAVFIDAVSVKNLQIGKSYSLSGTIMDKKRGRALVINGQEITSSKMFSYDDVKSSKNTFLSADGGYFSAVIELQFRLDSSALAGTEAVVSERLYRDDILLGAHEDLNDKDQSINIISIKTRAMDRHSATHTMTPGKTAELIDTVEYKGLTAGKKYTLKAVLMDKETGKALKINGRKVTAMEDFTAGRGQVKGSLTDGRANVSLTLDTSRISGSQLVVFESLCDADGNIIAEHKDISDAAQTVRVPAALHSDDDAISAGRSVKTGESFDPYLSLAALSVSAAVILILFRKRSRS